jgi:hypothetical protein
MCNLISRFIRDERGTLLITEWVFLTTILVIAAVPITFGFRVKLAELNFSLSRTDRTGAAGIHGPR